MARTLSTALLCVVISLFFIDIEYSTAVLSHSEWKLPRPVKGYKSYLDVYPQRFILPERYSQVFWTFRAQKSSKNCPDKRFFFQMRPRGLPLVKQTNWTFPNDFLMMREDDSFIFNLTTSDFPRLYIITFPRPGPWYVIAYTDETKSVIRQKGLDNGKNCFYFFMSRMENGQNLHAFHAEIGKTHKLLLGNESSMISFKVLPSTTSFEFKVLGCDPANCNITLNYKMNQVACTNGTVNCSLVGISPSLDQDEMVFVRAQDDILEEITFVIIVMGCPPYYSATGHPSCVAHDPLDRIDSTLPNSAAFCRIQMNIVTTTYLIAIAPVVVIPFEILEFDDIGGTLQWRMKVDNFTEKDVSVVKVCTALKYDHLPVMGNITDLCSELDDALTFNSTPEKPGRLLRYVPYPKAGIWHVVIQALCFSDSGSSVECPKFLLTDLLLQIVPCVDHTCNGKGECLYPSNHISVPYSACSCDGDYQGYGCTDSSEALSSGTQILAALLLTLSNMAFIPAVFIAIRRRYIVEAFVFFYTMFFSTFYHACDGNRINMYKYCLMKYEVLQNCDFFGSACSLWFTLVAMARIRLPYVTPLLQAVGPFGILIGILYDKTSLCVIAVPIFVGLAIIACSWGAKMYKRRQLYPSWKRYLFFLVPGVILAAIGASVFSFLETDDNYFYIHSIWHLCIAHSICFLLPPRHPHQNEKTNSDSSIASTELIVSKRSQRLVNEEQENMDNESYVPPNIP